MPQAPFLWDIFCQVIDNHGDLGVCWRLSQHLVSLGHRVRLYVDDSTALAWMAPHHQNAAHLSVLDWPREASWAHQDAYSWQMPQCVVEAFGCEIPNVYLHALLTPCIDKELSTRWTWINLEYLSAEDYPERMHTLACPVLSGPAKGLKKWFFYPGFTSSTGGLLKKNWPGQLLGTLSQEMRQAQALKWTEEADLRVFVFSYEPLALKDLLLQLLQSGKWVHLKVSAGRSTTFTRALLQTDELMGPEANIQEARVQLKNLTLDFLDHVDHAGFDALLQSSDLNFVRGEDSWVRAIWANKPFVWQIYPQDDGIHFKKMSAFLNLFEAPSSLKQAHLIWNGFDRSHLPQMNEHTLQEWAQWCQQLCVQLQTRADLAVQLSEFLKLKQH